MSFFCSDLWCRTLNGCKQMIKEAGMEKYGYVRVSTNEQNSESERVMDEIVEWFWKHEN